MGAKRYGYFRSGEVFCRLGGRVHAADIPAQDLARPELLCQPFVSVSIIRFASSRRMPGSSECNAMDSGVRRNDGLIRGSLVFLHGGSRSHHRQQTGHLARTPTGELLGCAWLAVVRREQRKTVAGEAAPPAAAVTERGRSV